MMTVALVSQKGGAGKSTLALHLTAEAATRGRRALLIDLDPQGNIAKWGDPAAMPRRTSQPSTLPTWMESGRATCVESS